MTPQTRKKIQRQLNTLHGKLRRPFDLSKRSIGKWERINDKIDHLTATLRKARRRSLILLIVVTLTTSLAHAAPPPEPWPDQFTLTIGHTRGIDDVAGVLDGEYLFMWSYEASGYIGGGTSPGPGWSGQLHPDTDGPIFGGTDQGDELDVALALNGTHVAPTITYAGGAWSGATVHAPEPSALCALLLLICIHVATTRRRAQYVG